MARNFDKEEQCPVILTQNLVGGKWKISIIWLLHEEAKRFNELKRLLPKITHAMLAQQLRELENDGLVHREVYPEVPPRVEYSLTPIGCKFLPVIDLMGEWGNEYLEEKSVNISS